jgi:TonB family protein
MKRFLKIGAVVCPLALVSFAGGSSAAVSQGANSQGKDDHAPAAAPSPPSKEPVYEPGHGVASPRVIHQVAPDHPARGFRISGTVLIGLIVTSKGEPDEVHVIRSLDKDVDQSAVDAVRQWRFDPATKEGKPVAVKISVEIRFHDM